MGRGTKDYHKIGRNSSLFFASRMNLSSRGHGFYYGTAKRRLGVFWKRLILFSFITLFVGAVGGAIYFVFFHSYFSIKNIGIAGLEKISQAEIRDIIEKQKSQKRFFILSESNIFIFNDREVYSEINAKYALKSLKIEKFLPDTVEVVIKESKPALYWKSNDKFYEVDELGMVIRELTQGEINDLVKNTIIPVVYDEKNQEIEIKNIVMQKTAASFVCDFQKLVGEKTNLKISIFRTEGHMLKTIRASTTEGWDIILSIDRDATNQMNDLILFLKDRKSRVGRKFEYVDLRYADRVYYK